MLRKLSLDEGDEPAIVVEDGASSPVQLALTSVTAGVNGWPNHSFYPCFHTIRISMTGYPLSMQIELLEDALSELFAQVTQSGRLTQADRYGLLAALLRADDLADDERFAIDRMLFAVIRGRVQVVDEISAVQSDS